MFGITEPVLSIIDKVIDKAIPDRDVANKAKHEARMAVIDSNNEEMKTARDIIVAEIKAGGASASWRPHLMYLFMAFIVYNGMIVPTLSAFTGISFPVADAMSAIPSQMWTLMTICVGGYVGSRGMEKVSKSFFDSKNIDK